MAAIHGSSSLSNRLVLVRSLGWKVLWLLSVYRYKHLDMLVAGVEDFLRGPDDVFRQNVPQRLSELSALTYLTRSVSLDCQGGRHVPTGGFQQLFFNGVPIATLGGHLLSPFLSTDTVLVNSSAPKSVFLRIRGAVFFATSSGVGYEARRSLRCFLSCCMKVARCLVRLAVA